MLGGTRPAVQLRRGAMKMLSRERTRRPLGKVTSETGRKNCSSSAHFSGEVRLEGPDTGDDVKGTRRAVPPPSLGSRRRRRSRRRCCCCQENARTRTRTRTVPGIRRGGSASHTLRRRWRRTDACARAGVRPGRRVAAPTREAGKLRVAVICPAAAAAAAAAGAGAAAGLGGWSGGARSLPPPLLQ